MSRKYYWNISTQLSSIQLHLGEESPVKYRLLIRGGVGCAFSTIINISPPPGIANHLGRLLTIRLTLVRPTQTFPLYCTDSVTALV
jgi:hypothetical protein